MTHLFARLKSVATKFLRWYRTPVGLLSLLLIVVTAGLVLADATRWAVLVAVVWMATILPHKLMRERRDWERVLHESRRDSQTQLSAVSADVSRIFADITSIPTSDEMTAWQSSIETTQSVANSRIFTEVGELEQAKHALQKMVDGLSASVSSALASLDGKTLANRESIELLQSSVFEAETLLKDLETRTPLRRIDELSISRDVQAITALYASLEPETSIPPLGDWALSPSAAITLATLVLNEKPDVVVETGSGSSTVIVAMALAKVGGGQIISLEHDLQYARQTRKMLGDHGLEKFATVIDAPLTSFRIGAEDYLWYGIPEDAISDSIDVLLVDGPPGSTGALARLPALPLLIDSLSPKAYILVDDLQRSEESTIVEKWQELFPLYRAGRSADGDLLCLRMGSNESDGSSV